MESFISSQKKYSAALAEEVNSITTDELTENRDGGKQKHAPKAPKDPDTPKRPASSYLDEAEGEGEGEAGIFGRIQQERVE